MLREPADLQFSEREFV